MLKPHSLIVKNRGCDSVRFVAFGRFKDIKKRLSNKFGQSLDGKEWSHLGLNQGLPDYESGALTN